MSRKIITIDLDDLRERHKAGQRFSEIARAYNVSVNVILRRARDMGLQMGKIGSRLPADEIISKYASGAHERELARDYGVERAVIKHLLVKNGIQRRGCLEANRLMMSKRTPAEHLKNTQAAHMAVKGKPQSDEFRRKVALGRERSGRLDSFGEKLIADELIKKGFEITPQKAVGRYNIDIAIPELCIAVEVFGGSWHANGSHADRFRERFNYLVDSGWVPVVVWFRKSVNNDVSGAIKYICSLADSLRRNEPVRREEHVISRSGNPCSAGKNYIEYRAAVGGDKCGDIIRGIDGRFCHDTVGMCG